MMLLRSLLHRWVRQNDGMAVMETAMLFPILLVMLLGVYDVGHAITVNHKMITASNAAADLLTRSQSVSDRSLDQAIKAAGLAMNPYADSDDIGIDIISVQYDDDDQPEILWRESKNMASNGGLEAQAADRSFGLGTKGEGVLMVTVLYDYEPTFGSMVINAFRMREVAFSRGRRSSVVTRE